MKINSVCEPLVEYMKIGQVDPAPIYSLAAGDNHEFFRDTMLMNRISKEGIPFHVFSEIRKAGPLTLEEWADILGISSKTLTRYSKEDKVFQPWQSAVILQVTEILTIGQDIFPEQQHFSEWLGDEVFALGAHTPTSLLTNAFGRELVLRELVAIDHGIFA